MSDRVKGGADVKMASVARNARFDAAIPRGPQPLRSPVNPSIPPSSAIPGAPRPLDEAAPEAVCANCGAASALPAAVHFP